MNKYTFLRIYRFLSTFFLVLLFIPGRKERRIIFMSSFKGDFTSNSKYLFEDVIKSNVDYQCRFVICDDVERARLTELYGNYFISNKSIADKIYCLRSSVWVCSYFDLPVQGLGLAINRKVLHLGHGIPVKASGLLENKVSILKRIYYYLNTSNFTYHFAPTEEVASILSNMFGCSTHKFIYASQPRADRIVKLNSNYSKKDKLCKVLYAPTWRYNDKGSFLKFDDFNISELDRFLKENHIVLYYRPHPLFLPEDQSFLSENIKLSTPETEPEISDYLHTYDALISDYSSIIIDYLILDRPIAIYDYDYEIYKEENGFCYEFDGFCPGIRINSQEELIYFFSNFQNNDGMREKRGIESERFNGKVNNSVKVFKKEVLERDNVK
ncbi:CDP-glycerol glycerophosphotransferase family protein [Vibrio splendidus]|uniref:CDP-glycerol glycerophosphotransferase family protein n=1 Tax=Vibrio splendidus TaxID=29497 RepID=UPI0020A462B2|nr:CDP-glycerol glycerophosphotransferase family protein [Vibrio splendidus]